MKRPPRILIRESLMTVSYTHLDVYKRQEENISRAAERLHVTQPTLSRQMAALEEERCV